MDTAPISVGLAGDGDEISAIDDVERAFSIKFDYDDASNWITAGDLFASLNRKLSAIERSDTDLWDRFAIALSQETGVNPQSLTPESPLILSGHPWRGIHDSLAWAWILGFVLVAIVIVAALLVG
jgi:hypothetical protein